MCVMITETYDLVVIGAGPSGIAAAVEAKRGGLERVYVLEKGSSHSQMIRTYYKEGKRVDAQYAGQEAICFGLLCLKDGNRESYMALMDHVIRENNLNIGYNTEVWSVKKTDERFLEVVISADRKLKAQAVLLAIGKMGRPNQPDYYKEVPTSLKTSKVMLFDITSRPLNNQKVLVVGGGDSAAEYCDILSTDNQVTLSYRKATFSRVNSLNGKILEQLLASEKVKAYLPSNITKIEDQNGQALVYFKEDSLAPEAFDAVVYALGGMNPVEFLRSSGVTLSERGDVLTDEHHETSIPGLYVVGDLLGKGRGGGSIISGFNSATAAVRALLSKHFHRELAPEVVQLDHLKF
jgi:thioredoxin reductase (NADPH)